MRNGLFIVFLFGIAHGLFSQEPTEKEKKKHIEKVQKSREKGKNVSSLDTLFASGKPYCIMKAMNKSFLGTTEYSVSPMKTNEELIYLQFIGEGPAGNQTFYWDMSFLTENKKIRFPQGTDMENTIVDYKLITDTGLNIAGMNKLLLVKGQKPVNIPIAPAVAKPAQVERDRNGMIQIIGDNILQGGAHIGNVSQKSVTSGGELYYQITVTSSEGEIIAIAKNNGITDHTWNVVTAKNNQSNTIAGSLGKDKDEVVKFLVDNLYL